MLRALPAAAVVALLPIAANATPTTACVPPDHIAPYLSGKYGEVRIGSRPAEFGARHDLYVSQKGTWTLLHVTKDQACMLEAGSNWSVPAFKLGEPV